MSLTTPTPVGGPLEGAEDVGQEYLRMVDKPIVEFFTVIPYQRTTWSYEIPDKSLLMAWVPEKFMGGDEKEYSYARHVEKRCHALTVAHVNLLKYNAQMEAMSKSNLNTRSPNNANGKEYNPLTLDVFRDWRYAGVTITTPPEQKNIVGLGSKPRMIQYVPRGKTRILNYWGPGVRNGDYCFMVSKAVNARSRPRFSVSPIVGIPQATPVNVPPEWENWFIEDVAVFSHEPSVPAHLLEYTDPYGNIHIATARPICRVVTNPHVDAAQTRHAHIGCGERAVRDLHELMGLPALIVDMYIA